MDTEHWEVWVLWSTTGRMNYPVFHGTREQCIDFRLDNILNHVELGGDCIMLSHTDAEERFIVEQHETSHQRIPDWRCKKCNEELQDSLKRNGLL